jgi:hypothetical protein
MTNPLKNLGRVRPSEDGAGWLCGLCPDPHDSYRSAIECRRRARKLQERDAAEQYQAQSRQRRARRVEPDEGEAPAPPMPRTRGRRAAVSSGRKSQLVGFVLTFLFGPIGLFYSSVPAALALTIGASGLTGIFFVFLPALFLELILLVVLMNLLLWLVSIGLSFATVAAFNRRAAVDDRRHEELVAATRDRR